MCAHRIINKSIVDHIKSGVLEINNVYLPAHIIHNNRLITIKGGLKRQFIVYTGNKYYLNGDRPMQTSKTTINGSYLLFHRFIGFGRVTAFQRNNVLIWPKQVVRKCYAAFEFSDPDFDFPCFIQNKEVVPASYMINPQDITFNPGYDDCAFNYGLKLIKINGLLFHMPEVCNENTHCNIYNIGLGRFIYNQKKLYGPDTNSELLIRAKLV